MLFALIGAAFAVTGIRNLRDVLRHDARPTINCNLPLQKHRYAQIGRKNRVSLAHAPDDIAATLHAFGGAIRAL